MDKKNIIRRHIGVLAAAVGLSMPVAAELTTPTDEDPDIKYAVSLLKPGTTAPDFALPTPQGDTLRLSDYRGHYVVLDFWASWCPDCRKDAPRIVQLQQTYAERGMTFIGVSFDTDTAAWTKAIADFGIKYPQVSPLRKWKTTDIYRAYGVEWIPSLYVIDPTGKIVLATVVSDKVADTLARISPTCDE